MPARHSAPRATSMVCKPCCYASCPDSGMILAKFTGLISLKEQQFSGLRIDEKDCIIHAVKVSVMRRLCLPLITQILHGERIFGQFHEGEKSFDRGLCARVLIEGNRIADAV